MSTPRMVESSVRSSSASRMSRPLGSPSKGFVVSPP